VEPRASYISGTVAFLFFGLIRRRITARRGDFPRFGLEAKF